MSLNFGTGYITGIYDTGKLSQEIGTRRILTSRTSQVCQKQMHSGQGKLKLGRQYQIFYSVRLQINKGKDTQNMRGIVLAGGSENCFYPLT